MYFHTIIPSSVFTKKSVNTGDNGSIEPFIRLGIVNGYIYADNGITGTYKTITSPLIYITKGTSMNAQCSTGFKNYSKLYCKIDE